jgi:hypothetical protein
VNYDIELSHIALPFRSSLPPYITVAITRQGICSVAIPWKKARQTLLGCGNEHHRGGKMIRPEFRKILVDQRGAAIILWSFFSASIPIYLLIARHLLANPNLGTNQSIAQPARIIFWLLTIVDLGYYAYWRKQNLAPAVIRRDARKTKLFRALEDYQGRDEEQAAYNVSTFVTRKVVIFAIIEALAVYGFVLAFLGRFVFDQYLLSLLSLVLLAAEFPSEKTINALLQQGEHSTSV